MLSCSSGCRGGVGLKVISNIGGTGAGEAALVVAQGTGIRVVEGRQRE